MIPSPLKTIVPRTLIPANLAPGRPPALAQPNALRGGMVDFENLLRNALPGLTDMNRLEAHVQGMVHHQVHKPMQAMQANMHAFRNAMHQTIAGPNGNLSNLPVQATGPASLPEGGNLHSTAGKAGAADSGGAYQTAGRVNGDYDYQAFRRASAAQTNQAHALRTPGASVDGLLPARARAFGPAIEQAAERFGLNPELIVSVIKAESNFNPKAVSKKGAMGLMQLMPDTARAMGAKDPFSPHDNIMAGSKYLKGMHDRFGDRKLALAAYNAGPGRVEQYGGIPPYMETRRYVEKVLANLSAE